MTEDGPPPSWVSTHLGALIDGFDAGRNLRAHGRPADATEYGVLKISAVSWGAFNPAENKALLPGDEPRPREVVRNGDLLISRANTTELVGAVVRVEGDYPRLMLPDKVLRLRVRSSLVDPAFLVYALRRSAARKHMESNATGTSDSMRNLSQPKIEATPVLLPPLNEQRRIVSKLEALQARGRSAREALDAVPPLLEKLRQSILAAAFRGDLTKDWRAKNKNVEPATKLLARIRTERRKKWEEAELAKMKAKGKPPSHDKWKERYKEAGRADTADLPNLPDGWCWTSVDDTLQTSEDLFDGPFGSALKTDDYVAQGVRVIRLENIANLHFRADKQTFISPEKYETLRRHSVREGDVIFGSFVEEATRVCVLPELGGPAIAKADCFCVRPDPAVVRTELLVFALGSHHAREELARGIHGATRARINTGQLRALPIALPSLPEQDMLLERIQAGMGVIRRLAIAHKELGASLSTLDRAILAKAFEGELVAQDADDEPVNLMLATHGATETDLDGALGSAKRATARKRRAV